MKKIFWVLIVFFILVIAGSFIFGYVNSTKFEGPAGNYSSVAVPINYSNIEVELSQSYLIKAVPSGEAVSLKFFNFDSGERQTEKSFIIRKGSLIEGEEKTEVNLLLHSKYLEELTNQNFCEVLKKANQNGDLEIETDLSDISLGWKFKSMYDFKDCF
jgi:hypothetical protein